MNHIFFGGAKEAEDGNTWHIIQSHFRQVGYDLQTPATYTGRLEDASWVIFQNMPAEFKPLNFRRRVKRNVKRLFSEPTFYEKCLKAGLSENLAVILYEPEIVTAYNYDERLHKLFKTVFTWNTPLFQSGAPYSEFVYPQPVHPAPLEVTTGFKDRKLICNFSANKNSSHPNELYSARIETIRFFEEHCLSDFDHFGRGWSSDYKSWRGPASNKNETMAKYKFNLCYENAQNFPGYVTEKIFDAFYAGCVPVYWGAPDIELRIPSSCFIDRRQFKSNAELLHFLNNVDEPTWLNYISAAQDYLKSEAYAKHEPSSIFELLKRGLAL